MGEFIKITDLIKLFQKKDAYQIQPLQDNCIIKLIGKMSENDFDILIKKFDYFVFNCIIISKLYSLDNLKQTKTIPIIEIIIKEGCLLLGKLSYNFTRLDEFKLNDPIKSTYSITLTTIKSNNTYILNNNVLHKDHNSMIVRLLQFLKTKDIIDNLRE